MTDTTMQNKTMADQLSRASAVREVLNRLFPEVAVSDDRVMTWVLTFPDSIILLGLRRAASKRRKNGLSDAEAMRYASGVMKHESRGEHTFAPTCAEVTR